MSSQAKKAYELIENMIVSMKLEPGLKISEKSLSDMLGMGRTPIREALLRLAFEGTILVAPRSGIIISEIDTSDQFRLIEVRRELERIIARRSAQLSTPDERRQFSALADHFMKAAAENDENLFIKTDREFNQLLASSAQNKYASIAMSAIQAQTRRFWYLYFKKFGDLPHICQLHAKVAIAIVQENPTKAQKASDELLDYVEEYTTRTIKAL